MSMVSLGFPQLSSLQAKPLESNSRVWQNNKCFSFLIFKFTKWEFSSAINSPVNFNLNIMHFANYLVH